MTLPCGEDNDVCICLNAELAGCDEFEETSSRRSPGGQRADLRSAILSASHKGVDGIKGAQEAATVDAAVVKMPERTGG